MTSLAGLLPVTAGQVYSCFIDDSLVKMSTFLFLERGAFWYPRAVS